MQVNFEKSKGFVEHYEKVLKGKSFFEQITQREYPIGAIVRVPIDKSKLQTFWTIYNDGNDNDKALKDCGCRSTDNVTLKLYYYHGYEKISITTDLDAYLTFHNIEKVYDDLTLS